jgi:SAM-dependent methyltransferase
MDAEALDLPEGTFNAVLCRFGLMFLPDLDGALDTFRRLLVPGGRLAAAVWGETAKVPMIPLLHSVAQRELTIPPAPPGTPTVFSLADQGRLERALLGAGFTAVQSEAVAVNAEWPSRRDYVQFAQDISAALKGLLERYPAEKWEAVWQAIGDAAAEYAGSDGTVRMANEAICVVGQR